MVEDLLTVSHLAGGKAIGHHIPPGSQDREERGGEACGGWRAGNPASCCAPDAPASAAGTQGCEADLDAKHPDLQAACVVGERFASPPLYFDGE